MAVYGGIELALRSAETFNDMVRSSTAQDAFTRALRQIWMHFLFAGLRPTEAQQATVLIMTWVKQLGPVLTFNLGNFNYVTLRENFLIK